MTILREQAEKILYGALQVRVGLQVKVLEEGEGIITPSLRAKQILYRFRQEIGDVELQRLAIHLCPEDPDGRLWITKGAGANGEGANGPN